MILVDASVWIDHIHAPDDIMLKLLADSQVLVHPFVIGEIALGHVRRREVVLAEIAELPRVEVCTDDEVLQFIADNRLFGLGIGYIDAHLLVSCKLTVGAAVWTFDKRLQTAATKLGLSADRP